MKTKIYTILLLALIILSALIFNSCSKYEPTCIKHTYTFTLSDDDKSKVPYTGNDTLIFISNTNDTIKCIGTGKVIAQNYKDAGGSPDCPPFTNTNCYEKDNWNFVDLNMNFSISILQTNDNTIGDNINFNNTNIPIDFRSVSNENITFYSYYDSLLIRDKMYHKVSRVISVGKNQDTTKMFINSNNGILKVEYTINGKNWTLSK